MAGYQGNKKETRALRTFVKLMRTTETLSGKAHGHLKEGGLTVSQFGVLEALYHLGPMSQKEIAQKILKTPGNLTMVIDNLEKRGLVSKERSQKDRRYLNIALTDDGSKAIAKHFPNHASLITD